MDCAPRLTASRRRDQGDTNTKHTTAFQLQPQNTTPSRMRHSRHPPLCRAQPFSHRRKVHIRHLTQTLTLAQEPKVFTNTTSTLATLWDKLLHYPNVLIKSRICDQGGEVGRLWRPEKGGIGTLQFPPVQRLPDKKKGRTQQDGDGGA